MYKECYRTRVKFIDSIVDVRLQFAFAQPQQVLKMVQILYCDAYGSMLWDLQSDPAEQFFKCWNNSVSLVYQVPRSTFTYLVEDFSPPLKSAFETRSSAVILGLTATLFGAYLGASLDKKYLNIL